MLSDAFWCPLPVTSFFCLDLATRHRGGSELIHTSIFLAGAWATERQSCCILCGFTTYVRCGKPRQRICRLHEWICWIEPLRCMGSASKIFLWPLRFEQVDQRWTAKGGREPHLCLEGWKHEEMGTKGNILFCLLFEPNMDTPRKTLSVIVQQAQHELKGWYCSCQTDIWYNIIHGSGAKGSCKFRCLHCGYPWGVSVNPEVLQIVWTILDLTERWSRWSLQRLVAMMLQTGWRGCQLRARRALPRRVAVLSDSSQSFEGVHDCTTNDKSMNQITFWIPEFVHKHVDGSRYQILINIIGEVTFICCFTKGQFWAN